MSQKKKKNSVTIGLSKNKQIKINIDNSGGKKYDSNLRFQKSVI